MTRRHLPGNRPEPRHLRGNGRRSSVAYALLQGDRMKAERRSQAVDRRREEQTVLVIGGSGGMSSRYRDVVEKHGWSLRHYENRVPPGARHGVGRIALIVIMVTMVSHRAARSDAEPRGGWRPRRLPAQRLRLGAARRDRAAVRLTPRRAAAAKRPSTAGRRRASSPAPLPTLLEHVCPAFRRLALSR